MKLTYDTASGEYRCFTTCKAEGQVAKAAGLRFNPNNWTTPFWWTKFTDSAAKLVQYADDSCKAQLVGMKQRAEENLEASRASTSAANLPVPGGLDYMPFQKAGITALIRIKRAYLGDDPGLGKTIQGIGLINAVESIKRVLVVCPASLKVNWKRELEKWLTRKLRVVIADSQMFPGPQYADVVICNYDILRKMRQHIRSAHWDLVIFDEAHYLKNKDAQRTEEVTGVTQKEADYFNRKNAVKIAQGKKEAKVPSDPLSGEYEVWMSGTPILNRPIEGWTAFHHLDPTTFSSWWHYTHRFCGAVQDRWGLDVSGASHMDELQDKLRRSILIRRLKKDVLTDLPDKRRQVLEISVETEQQRLAVGQELAEWEKHEPVIERLRVQLELAKAGDDEAEYKAAVDALRSAQGVAFAEMSKVRHDVGVSMVSSIVKLAVDDLEGGVEKLVLWAHHHDVIDGIMHGLAEYGAVKLTGEMTKPEDRQAAVDRFQNDPTCRVFVGSIKAAGVGYTLTAASNELFAELDWTPGWVTQCEDRCHRIGQKDSVFIRHCVLEGSLGVKMAKDLVAKQEVIDRALDRKTARPVEAELPAVPVDGAASKPATVSTSRKQLDEAAAKMTEAEIAEVHRKLRFLAGMDADHAREQNNIGFNKIDNEIGHSLAESPRLTPRQGALGAKIIKKYHRQFGE